MFHVDKMNGLKQHVNYSCRLLVKSISRIVPGDANGIPVAFTEMMIN